jgi:hypothetical protein
VVLAIAATAFFVAAHWPFTREGITHALEGSSAQTVEIESFRRLYFPPGCVAERVRFLHAGKTVMTAEEIAIRGKLTTVFSTPKQIAEVRVTGLKVRIPPANHGNHPHPQIPLNMGQGKDSVTIHRVTADGTVLEFLPDQTEEKPFRLEIRKLEVTDIAPGTPMSYRAILLNTVPPGEIQSEGKFGPWLPEDPGSTPVAGTFRYDRVNLGVFHGISGKLEAAGDFRGILRSIRTKGTTDVPAFRVEGGQPVHLQTRFNATVNGLNGDTLLESVTAKFRRTELAIHGPIAGKPGQEGKTAKFDVAIRTGRIDDLMHMFGSDPRPPMSGAVNLKAKVTWPPGPAKFLQKILMEIDFAITGGTFASPSTQGSLDRLSASALGHADNDNRLPTAISELKGHASVKNGIGTFTPLEFDFPQSHAALSGSYYLLSKEVRLSGTLYTQGKLSKTTSGVKALMVRVITPLLKKKDSVRIVPFKITGPSKDATVSIDWR